MGELKKAGRDVQTGGKKALRGADGTSVRDRLGNAGDAARKELGNAGDALRDGGKKKA